MAVALYLLALLFASLSSYGHLRASQGSSLIRAVDRLDPNTPGLRPAFGSAAGAGLYRAAGAMAWLVMLGLIVGGFFVYPWWVPIAAWVGTSLVAGRCFSYLPAGAIYAAIGFPLSVGLAITWLLVK